MLFVVAYDIADDHRRTRVASELGNFGTRVQYSVFECHLTAAQVRELRQRLEAIIVWEQDRVRYYPLCHKNKGHTIIDSPGGVTQDWDYFLV